MTTPYRTAPAEQPAQKPPRASWWRRLTHRDVERRLDIRRRRHALRARFPWASWRDCQDAVTQGYEHAMVTTLTSATTPPPSATMRR